MVNRKQIYLEFAPLLDPKAALPAESSHHRNPGAFTAALQYGDEEGVEPFDELQYEDDTGKNGRHYIALA